MARPTTSADNWATNANHNDPGQPWDGQPNKVAPSAGMIASGFLPAVEPAAEHINHILSIHAEWIKYLEQFSGSRWVWFGGGEFVGLSVVGAVTGYDHLFWAFNGGSSQYIYVPLSGVSYPGSRLVSVQIVGLLGDASDTIDLHFVSTDPSSGSSAYTPLRSAYTPTSTSFDVYTPANISLDTTKVLGLRLTVNHATAAGATIYRVGVKLDSDGVLF